MENHEISSAIITKNEEVGEFNLEEYDQKLFEAKEIIMDVDMKQTMDNPTKSINDKKNEI